MPNEIFIAQGISLLDFLFYALMFVQTAVLILDSTGRFRRLKIFNVVLWCGFLLHALVFGQLEMKIFVTVLAVPIFILAFRKFKDKEKRENNYDKGRENTHATSNL